jgi:hypothetical protein
VSERGFDGAQAKGIYCLSLLVSVIQIIETRIAFNNAAFYLRIPLFVGKCKSSKRAVHLRPTGSGIL